MSKKSYFSHLRMILNKTFETLHKNHWSNQHNGTEKQEPLKPRWCLQCVAGHCYYQLLAQAACVRHVCLRAPCVACPLLSPSFSFFFSLSFVLRLLLLTHFGETPEAEIFSPPYFGITRRNIKIATMRSRWDTITYVSDQE